MSKVVLVFVAASTLLSLSLRSYSQNLIIPQHEFSVVTEDSLTLETGSQHKVGIWILRAKAFSKKNVRMQVSSTLPDGVRINFLPDRGHLDYSEAMISVNPATKAGVYRIIISGTINHKTKGHVVKLTVPASIAYQKTE